MRTYAEILEDRLAAATVEAARLEGRCEVLGHRVDELEHTIQAFTTATEPEATEPPTIG